MPTLHTPSLEIAYEDTGPPHGDPVVLLHGFPYDPRAFDDIVPPLVDAGCRTIVPYLRGYGPTRFLSTETPRSGQQAALGKDLVDLPARGPCPKRPPCWSRSGRSRPALRRSCPTRC